MKLKTTYNNWNDTQSFNEIDSSIQPKYFHSVVIPQKTSLIAKSIQIEIQYPSSSNKQAYKIYIYICWLADCRIFAIWFSEHAERLFISAGAYDLRVPTCILHLDVINIAKANALACQSRCHGVSCSWSTGIVWWSFSGTNRKLVFAVGW